jgi:hypothetical protein
MNVYDLHKYQISKVIFKSTYFASTKEKSMPYQLDYKTNHTYLLAVVVVVVTDVP